MGDFSVPCVLSGLPIASGQKVTAFRVRKARYVDHEIPYGPISIPTPGEMGDYGRVEDGTASWERDDADTAEGVHTVHAHAELFELAAEIFDEARPMKGSVYRELKSRRDNYIRERARYESLDPGNPGRHDEYCRVYVIENNLPNFNQEPWLHRLNHFTLGVSEKNTFKSALPMYLFALAGSDRFELDPTGTENECIAIQKLICVFGSTGITGRKIRPHGCTFEQYPTFVYEQKWHRAVSGACTRYRKEERE